MLLLRFRSYFGRIWKEEFDYKESVVFLSIDRK